MQIIEYAKAHPWQTGAVVVIGGIVFLVIFSGRGGEGSSGGSDRASDAEIAANAAIQSAMINAQATAAAAGAEIQKTNILAGVQMNSDKLESEVAMRGLEVSEALGLADIESNRVLGLATVDAQKTIAVKNIEGQIATQQIIANASKSKNKTNAITGVIGTALGTFASIFSDANLKQNIRYIGTDSDGSNIYEFNYRGSKRKYVGKMAQEIMRLNPEAVVQDKSGYMKVLPNMMVA